MPQELPKRREGRFNEHEWLRMLFMLSDMQTWLSEMEKSLFMKQPSARTRKLFQNTYWLTATAFAHIIERHYYKIPRHAGAAKFTIPVSEILGWLRAAAHEEALPITGSARLARQFNTDSEIGFDRAGNPTSIITIISDSKGKIITAFPGFLKYESSSASKLYPDEGNSDETSTLKERAVIYHVKSRALPLCNDRVCDQIHRRPWLRPLKKIDE